MTEQQISMLINILRYADQITPLQKDIIDTWDTLQKRPFGFASGNQCNARCDSKAV